VNKTKSKLKIKNFKAEDEAIEMLMKKARRYANGNLSAWIRHAGTKYVPKKGEKIF